MYPRLILITFVLSYVTAKNNCVFYVLDSEFTQDLNLVNCDSGSNDTPWQVVNFEKVKILPRSKDNINALFASTNSCVNVKIGFLSQGTLEADVYVSTPLCDVNMGIADTITSNESSLTSSYIHTVNKNSESGWRKLVVDIDKNINNALITLHASCNDGYVMVESFKHIPFGTSPHPCKLISKQKLSIFNEIIKTHKSLASSRLKHNVKSNAENIDVVITQILRNDEESFWTPLTISLISLSIVIVLIILAISAYQCGKSKGLDEVNNIFWNETDRTLTIPRARSIYSQSISRSRNSGQFP